MKYLKVFEKEDNYTEYKDSSEWITPNVSLIRETGGIKCKPYIPPAMAGDVAYWDGSKVKTTPLSSWDTSLGTPVGVVVVPEGFAPDGRVRIVSLHYLNSDGSQSDSYPYIAWTEYTKVDTSLTNYTKVPTTDNAGSTSTGSNNDGYLPSDSFTGIISFVDTKTKYYVNPYITSYIPSPYLGEGPNPEYYKELDGGNVLSDFNGLSNTQTLVGLGTGYTAANAAYKYNDGASNLQWYLPAMGELGYLMPRWNEVNNTITTLGGSVVISKDTSYYHWSSTERNNDYAYKIDFWKGYVNVYDRKDYYYGVRPFALI